MKVWECAESNEREKFIYRNLDWTVLLIKKTQGPDPANAHVFDFTLMNL